MHSQIPNLTEILNMVSDAEKTFTFPIEEVNVKMCASHLARDFPYFWNVLNKEKEFHIGQM